MWYDILLALMNHLISEDDLQGVSIQVGNQGVVPINKTIVLIRGSFDPKTTEPKATHAQTVYIECWEYDDSQDTKNGYEKLSRLEDIVMKSLNEFGAGSNLINNKRVQLRIGQTEPDGDAFRPSVGSRTAIKIRWQ